MSHLDGLDIGSRALVLAGALRDMASRANTARGASWEHGARSATTLDGAASLLIQLRDELDALTAERDRLRAHIDAAGDGANLVGLLDQYHEEAEMMRGERDAALAAMLAPHRMTDCVEVLKREADGNLSAAVQLEQERDAARDLLRRLVNDPLFVPLMLDEARRLLDG